MISPRHRREHNARDAKGLALQYITMHAEHTGPTRTKTTEGANPRQTVRLLNMCRLV